jgi:hypothetical protein
MFHSFRSELVDVYQNDYQQFQLDDTLFQLFDTLDSFDYSDGDSLYDVCVLQFTQAIPVLHWSIYLQSDSERGGPVYDVWYHPHQARWQRKESRANQVTHQSSMWEGNRPSGGYHGGTVLGTIDDRYAFQTIVRSTPLPGYGENCQTWVEKVVSTAINQGLLDFESLEKLYQVPRVGQGGRGGRGGW